MAETKFLQLNSQDKIAYQLLPGKSPGVIYCCGFRSDKNGTKAIAIEQFCRELGVQYLCFDHRGNGESTGVFTEQSIVSWREDALTILNQLTSGPQILIGSSMGAWIASLLIEAHPERIHGFITLGAAPDFTDHLLWNTFTPEQKKQLQMQGIVNIPCDYECDEFYPISNQLITESRRCKILDKKISFNGPIRLFHGMQDRDVPWQDSLHLAECFSSSDVIISLIKDGEHRLKREQDLALVRQAIINMIEK